MRNRPNHAPQRTAPRVTLAASSLRPPCSQRSAVAELAVVRRSTRSREMKISCVLIVCCLALLRLPLAAADADYLTYDKFIAAVDSGSVRSAALGRFSQITGTYTVEGTERPFKSYGGAGTANDILLMRLLKEKNVAVTLENQEKRPEFFGGVGMFSALLMFLVPILTLILAFRINSKLNRLGK